ncbi:MAG: NblA/ycf18 family protein [Pleurocapsa sp.]
MDVSAQLSLEQQFKLKVLQEQVQDLTKEQAQEYLLEMFRQMMVKDNLMKHLLKNA